MGWKSAKLECFCSSFTWLERPLILLNTPCSGRLGGRFYWTLSKMKNCSSSRTPFFYKQIKPPFVCRFGCYIPFPSHFYASGSQKTWFLISKPHGFPVTNRNLPPPGQMTIPEKPRIFACKHVFDRYFY